MRCHISWPVLLIALLFYVFVPFVLHYYLLATSLDCKKRVNPSLDHTTAADAEEFLPLKSNFLMPPVYDDDRLIVASKPPLRAIPPLLHLMWKDRMLPPFACRHAKEWHRLHPHWHIVLWTDADIRKLVDLSLDGTLLATFKKFEEPIMGVDFARYIILYLFGGTYADIDVTPLHSLDDVLQHHSCVIAREPDSYALSMGFDATVLASNFLMASIPGHSFWLTMMDCVRRAEKYRGPVFRTGPIVMTQALRERAQNMRLTTRSNAVFLAPSMYFFPPLADHVNKEHEYYLKDNCRMLKTRPKRMSAFAKRVCHQMATQGTMSTEAGRNHPRTFQHSFTRHNLFNSWYDPARKLTQVCNVDDLSVPVRTPDFLFNVLLNDSAFDREKRVLAS